MKNIEKKYNVFFFEYLKKQGYSKQQMYQFVKHNKFEKKAYGIFTIKDTDVTPLDYIKAYEKQCKKDIHVGGLSALRLQNISHNVLFNEKFQIFYNEDRINSWLRKNNDYLWITDNLFNSTTGITEKDDLRLSSPERAILETLSLLPKKGNFEEAYNTLILLPSLRPDVLEKLLIECKSIKVKRLFLYMIKYVEFKWRDRINLDNIDIGTGVRYLYPNGKLDTTYQIYVPEINNEI